jgi:HEAT repeat protein
MLGWLARQFAPGPPSRRALARRVRDPEPQVRLEAAAVLSGVAEPWACDELLVLMKDVFPEVRDAARDALRRHGPAATSALVQALEHGDPKVAVPAADLLGELRDLDAVRPLLLVMKFGTVEIRAAATRALIRYGRAAIPGLILATRDPDPWTRTRGEEILTEIRASEHPPAPVPPPAEPPHGPPGPPPEPQGP